MRIFGSGLVECSDLSNVQVCTALPPTFERSVGPVPAAALALAALVMGRFQRLARLGAPRAASRCRAQSREARSFIGRWQRLPPQGMAEWRHTDTLRQTPGLGPFAASLAAAGSCLVQLTGRHPRKTDASPFHTRSTRRARCGGKEAIIGIRSSIASAGRL